MSTKQFISSREVAQRLAMAGQVQNQTESAREELRRLTKAYNRQLGPPGFKVDVTPDAAGYRGYQIYRWDWDASREIILSAGVAKGSLPAVQAIARREAAVLNSN